MQKEKCQIIFFPMKFFPNYLLTVKLEELQMEIANAHSTIEIQERGNKYNLMLRKQNLANMIKDKIHIIE